MSRTQLGIQGSSRLRRALGLGLSGAALVGLIYFEGVSARAEDADAQEAGALADEDWNDEAEADEAEADEAAELAQSAVPAAIETSEPAADPKPMPAALAKAETAEPAVAAEPVVLAKADAKALGTETAEMPTDPEADLVVVPDLEGMTLRKARRELKAAGLKLSVRDEWGYKVARDEYAYYKVRSQKIEAGTKVEAGSWVRVKARERYEVFQGY
ncbi:PASTA domain-containing protein [Paraliomyxa miuraensis]|uniref:PASTA domain-containing protein n=1 Tax=Paraliomyxa miuraensis TaxID=376150 RepID=UPI0022568E03|nr:PASTA domain-containing protein [Paraliomyxa miuraensis]MCX4247778.1 PASTA domain-containing protein [Paraliomyxa miuraensis]